MANNETVIKGSKYDIIFKECMQRLTDKGVIAFINSMFEKDYSYDSKVSKFNNEVYLNGNKRVSDLYIGVDDRLFHIEVQSNKDKDMALRMFEYGILGAMQHGMTKNKVPVLQFPKPVVIYLRSNKNTPKTHEMGIILPDDNTYTFKIPAKRLHEYSAKDLLEQKLFPLIPFNSMKYSSELKSPMSVKKAENGILADIQYIIDSLPKTVEQGYISQQNAQDLEVKLMDLSKDEISSSKATNKEEVIQMIDDMDRTVMVRDIYLTMDAIEAKGEAKGETKAKVEIILNMSANNEKVSYISQITGVSEKKITEYQQKYADKITQLANKFKKGNEKAPEANKNTPKKSR